MKRIVFRLLAIMLIFGLSGCGTSGGGSSSGSSYSGSGGSSSSGSSGGSSTSQKSKRVAVYFYNDTSDKVKVVSTYKSKPFVKYVQPNNTVGIGSDADGKGTYKIKFYGASGASDGLFLYEYNVYDDIGWLDKTLCFNYFYNGGQCK